MKPFKSLKQPKKLRIAQLIVLLSWLSIFSVQAQSGIEGKWKNEKGVVISIYEEEGKYFGRLISSENAEQNKQIQDKEKIVLLNNFEKESDTKFCCGTIFQPKMKKNLNATLYLEDANTLKMKVKQGVFSGTKYWERI